MARRTGLPIDTCSRRLAPKLRQAGFAVVYREFDGHTMQPDILQAAVARLLNGGSS